MFDKFNARRAEKKRRKEHENDCIALLFVRSKMGRRAGLTLSDEVWDRLENWDLHPGQ